MSTDTQQPALFDCEDDGALLLPREELEKRYTSEQTQNLEWKRNAIVMLLGSDWPVETIAQQLHINTRTVRAIAARCAQEVAGSSKMFARICAGLGARWMGLAKTKENEASFLQLVTAAGIATDKAIVLETMGQIADVTETKEAPDRAAAMAALRAAMARPAQASPALTDSPSDALPSIAGETGTNPTTDAAIDATKTIDETPANALARACVPPTPGGGPDRPDGSPSPMYRSETGILPKEPPNELLPPATG